MTDTKKTIPQLKETEKRCRIAQKVKAMQSPDYWPGKEEEEDMELLDSGEMDIEVHLDHLIGKYKKRYGGGE